MATPQLPPSQHQHQHQQHAGSPTAPQPSQQPPEPPVPVLRAQDMPVRFPKSDAMFISHQGFHLSGNQCMHLSKVVEQLSREGTDFARNPYDVLCSVFNFVVKYAQQKHLLLQQQRLQQAQADANRPRVVLDERGRLWPNFDPTPANLATYMSESQLQAFALPDRSLPLFQPPPRRLTRPLRGRLDAAAAAESPGGSSSAAATDPASPTSGGQDSVTADPTPSVAPATGSSPSPTESGPIMDSRQRLQFELQMRLLKRVAELNRELEVEQLLAARSGSSSTSSSNAVKLEAPVVIPGFPPQPHLEQHDQQRQQQLSQAQAAASVSNSTAGGPRPELLHPLVRELLENMFFGEEQRNPRSGGAAAAAAATAVKPEPGIAAAAGLPGGADLAAALAQHPSFEPPKTDELRKSNNIVAAQQTSAYYARHVVPPQAPAGNAVLAQPQYYSTFSLVGAGALHKPDHSLYSRALLPVQQAQQASGARGQASPSPPAPVGPQESQRRDIVNVKLLKVSASQLAGRLQGPALPQVLQLLQDSAQLTVHPPPPAAGGGGSGGARAPQPLSRYDSDAELQRLRYQWQLYTQRKRAWQEDCLADNRERSCPAGSRIERGSGMRAPSQLAGLRTDDDGRQQEEVFAFLRRAEFHVPSPEAFPADLAAQEHQKMLLRQRYSRLVRLQQARQWFMQQNQSVPYYIERELRMLPLLELQQRVRAAVLPQVSAVDEVLRGRFRSRSRIVEDRRVAVEAERKHRQAQQRLRQEFQKGIVRRMREVHRSFVQFHKFKRQELKRIAQLPVRALEEKQAQLLEDSKRLERARLKALKADDEDEYYRLVEQTKNDRLKALLQQTDIFMSHLGAKIQQERRKEELETGVGPVLPVDISANPQQGAAGGSKAADKLSAMVGNRERFYGLAHQVQEKITKQPQSLAAGQLRSYQMQGLEWLVSLYNNRLNGILADEMGLGKTIQTISLLAHLMENKGEKGPFLVIAPMSTLHNNWAFEFQRWLPNCRTVVYDGQKPHRKFLRETAIRVGLFNVLLTTFDFAMIDKHFLRKIPWRYIIVDEAHRLKNPTCRLGQALALYNPHCRRVALTGTPLQNDLPELWSLLNFLHPQVFNSCENFERWFSSPLGDLELRSTSDARMNAGALSAAARAQVAGQEAATELTPEEKLLVVRRLHSMLRPFMLRREKKDVETQLAAKLEKILRCELTPVQLAMYQALWLGDVGMHNRMMQLRKVCNHPYLFHPYVRGAPGARDYLVQPYSPGAVTWANPGTSQHLPPGTRLLHIPLNMARPVGWAPNALEASGARAVELSEEEKLDLWRHYFHAAVQEDPMIQVCGKLALLDNILPKLRITGHRVLLFCQMTKCMDVLARYFEYRGYPYLRLDGNTGAQEREARLQQYNAPDSPYFMFMLSTKAGGLGLNLQSADTVILYDSDWNPQNDLQAQARAHRIGQKNRVLVLRLLTSDTVEERVMRASQNKLDAEKVVVRSGMFDRAEQDSQRRHQSRQMLEGVFLRDRGLEARDAAWLGGAAYKRYGRAYSRVMRQMSGCPESQAVLGNPFLRLAQDPLATASTRPKAKGGRPPGRPSKALLAAEAEAASAAAVPAPPARKGKAGRKRSPTGLARAAAEAEAEDDEMLEGNGDDGDEFDEDDDEEERPESEAGQLQEETGDEVQNDDEVSVAIARTPEELELFRKMDRIRREQLQAEAAERDRLAFMAPRWLNEWFLLGPQARSDDGELVPMYVPAPEERQAKQYLYNPRHLVLAGQQLPDTPAGGGRNSNSSGNGSNLGEASKLPSQPPPVVMVLDDDDGFQEAEEDEDDLDFGDRWSDDDSDGAELPVSAPARPGPGTTAAVTSAAAAPEASAVFSLPAVGHKRSHAQLEPQPPASPAAQAHPPPPVAAAAPAASATGLTLTFNFRRKPAHPDQPPVAGSEDPRAKRPKLG